MSQAYTTVRIQDGQYPYPQTDMHNQFYNPTSDTELINLAHEEHPVRYKIRPFDWFICSVLSYSLCCLTGICAVYYAVRANHAVDWDKDTELIDNHTKRAKVLTLISIALGSAFIVVLCIIYFQYPELLARLLHL